MAAPVSLSREQEHLIEQFEAAWSRGERPQIRDYLAEHADDLLLLGELVHADLEFRYKAGLDVRIDDYVREFPALAASADLLADLSTRESELRKNTPTRAARRRGGKAAPGDAVVGDVIVKSELRDFAWVARGGMGDVWLAEDGNLHRSVAVKVLQSDHEHDPLARQRFIQEAEIASRLEHPGIAPVYGVARQADGRPCYAMRFVRGETFTDAIRRFHHHRRQAAASSAGTQISDVERKMTFRTLLNHFVAVCNTIAYAHDCGVLHRDIKPDNIRLGKFGETVVLDWGLAKVIGSESQADKETTVIRASEIGSEAFSKTGDVFGTLRYMSPEQALGQREIIGVASDVFALGATLYEILTGEAPYHGQDVLRKARTAHYPPPRTLHRELPRALEAVCLKALARRPEDRYESARDLGQDVERFLADEPVTAHAETLAERSRRWIRKHPRSVAAVTAAMLVGFALVTPFALMLDKSNRQLAAANLDLNGTNEKLNASIDQLNDTNARLTLASAAERAAAAQAERERIAAETAQRTSDATANMLVDTLRSPDPRRNGRTVTVAELLDRAAARLRSEPLENAPLQAAMLQAVGDTYRGLGLFRTAIPLLEDAHTLRVAERGADDPTTLATFANVASAYHGAGEWNKSLPAFQRILPLHESQLGADHPITLQSLFNLAVATAELGNARQAAEMLERCWQRRQEVLGPEHPDTLAAYSSLAVVYKRTGRMDEALPIMQYCAEMRWELLGEDHQDTVTSLGNLAAAFLEVGRASEAIPLFERCWNSDRQTLGENHRGTLNTLSNWAEAYKRANQPQRAIPLIEDCLARRQAALGPDHPETLISLHNLASAYRSVGRGDEAMELFSRCVELSRTKLGADSPHTMKYANSLAVAYREGGQFELALPLFEECLAWRRSHLGVRDPSAVETLGSYALTLALLGRRSAAEQQLADWFQLTESLGPREAAAQWRRVYQAGLELARLSREIELAETCLNEALRRGEVWSATAADTAASALCLADQRLLAGDFAAAHEKYLALAAKPVDGAAWIDLSAHLGLAAACAGTGDWSACDRVLSEYWPQMADSVHRFPLAHRRTLLAIAEQIQTLLVNAGRFDEALVWQEQLEWLQAQKWGVSS